MAERERRRPARRASSAPLRRAWAGTLRTLSILASLAILAPAPAALPPDLDRLRTRGEIRIGYQASAFPFSYVARGGDDASAHRYIGYSVDLCTLVVARVEAAFRKDGGQDRLRVTPVEVTSRTRIPHLLTGNIDLECGSTTASPARRRLVALQDSAIAVDFSSTIFFSDIAVAVPIDSPLQGVADLLSFRSRPVTLMTVSGTTSVAHVATFLARPGGARIEVVSADDLGDGFERFSSTRRADAFVLDRILLRSRLPADRYRQLSGRFADEPESYALMLRKGDTALRALVEEALACAAIDGDFRRIYERWFVQRVPRDRKQPGTDFALGIAMPNELSAQIEKLALVRCEH